MKCLRCEWNGQFIDYKIHSKTHENIICPHCSAMFANEISLNNHLDAKIGTCEKQPFNCLFSKIGCHTNLNFNRKTLNEHFRNECAYHLELTYNDIEPRLNRIENHFQITNTTTVELNATASPSNISSQESSISDDISLKVKSKTQRESSDISNKKAKSSEDGELNSKMTMLEYHVKCIGDDLNKSVHSTEKLSKELEEVKINEKKLKEEVDALQKTLTFAQATIINLEERLIAQEKASFNGTLVWKISNIREKIQEAKSGRQTSIYSPPFYTHQNGFKMCGRIYLNGDGMGRNTHVSLFFVIMRGEYDALLRWPFRQKVTFILMDQTTNESRENIIDAFRPDPNSNSFKKPTSDMNIASGIPLFCPLSKLNSNEHEYVKDDCMFIKIIVDSRDLIDI